MVKPIGPLSPAYQDKKGCQIVGSAKQGGTSCFLALLWEIPYSVDSELESTSLRESSDRQNPFTSMELGCLYISLQKLYGQFIRPLLAKR